MRAAATPTGREAATEVQGAAARVAAATAAGKRKSRETKAVNETRDR